MNLQIVSDLHFEAQKDGGRALLSRIYSKTTDVLVIAGDLDDSYHITDSIRIVCEKFKKALVIFVPGNHDFYGADIRRMLDKFSRLEQRVSNYRCLYNSSLLVSDRRFIGRTLWFPRTEETQLNKFNLNDFYYIKNFENDVHVHNTAAIAFLQRAKLMYSYVITHHLPTQRSIPGKDRDKKTNVFYVNSLDDLIFLRKPFCWIHGHIHESFDYMYYRTRVICNPFGYTGKKQNEQSNGQSNEHFNEKLFLRI